jgi:hypothetical protein
VEIFGEIPGTVISIIGQLFVPSSSQHDTNVARVLLSNVPYCLMLIPLDFPVDSSYLYFLFFPIILNLN